MTNKVLLMVLLPANRTYYEFLLPYDLDVKQGASVISHMLERRERVRYRATDDALLMPLEGRGEGKLLDARQTFGSCVASEVLVDGMRVALM